MNDELKFLLYENDDTERWKEFARTENSIYYVSSFGRVKRVYACLVQSHLNRNRGYRDIKIKENGVDKTRTVHRIVAKAFVPNPENKEVVNHKDGNKQNNCADNLEWVTAQENVDHAITTGLIKFKRNSGNLKFSDEDIKEVVRLIKEEGWTYGKAGASKGMSYSTVAHIMTGRRRQIEGITSKEGIGTGVGGNGRFARTPKHEDKWKEIKKWLDEGKSKHFAGKQVGIDSKSVEYLMEYHEYWDGKEKDN